MGLLAVEEQIHSNKVPVVELQRHSDSQHKYQQLVGIVGNSAEAEDVTC